MENLESKLLAYAGSDAYAFHMPGHKRMMDPIGLDIGLDITEIDGFDNLHDAKGILKAEMERAAVMYGVREALFSVNGSTCALLAAISAAVPKGGTILIERGCHMAVYHAAYLRELEVKYVEDYPDLMIGSVCDAERSVSKSGQVLCEGSFDSLGMTGGRRLDAVVITSPTYEGCMKDVAGWAEMVHAAGAVLIVDEAHGAHLGFHPYFPKSAVQCGADLVIQSTHKTLPAMTQTALLHNVSGRVSTRRLQFFMDIYETSSPSYVLMASITASLRLIRERGDALFAAYADRLRKARRELCCLKHFRLAGGEEAVLSEDDELPPYKAGTRMDPGKLVLMVRDGDWKSGCGDTGITANLQGGDFGAVRNSEEAAAAFDGNASGAEGFTEKWYDAPWLYGELRDAYHLQMEMHTNTYCLAMTSIADTEAGFERLVTAMREIDRRVGQKMDAGTKNCRDWQETDAGTKIRRDWQETDAGTKIRRRGDKIRKSTESEGMGSRTICVPVICGEADGNGRKISEALDAPSVMVPAREAACAKKISEALDAPSVMVPAREATGCVCADFVILYPPDVPLIVPGEVYTQEKISEILGFIARGSTVIGIGGNSDPETRRNTNKGREKQEMLVAQGEFSLEIRGRN